MQAITLIQLISAQTMPNLLPMLRLRPAHLIHLATPKTVERAGHLLRAANAAGFHPCVETILLSAMPGIPEVYQVVKNLVLRGQDGSGSRALPAPVVNFTGGTKLMSIGAFAAASELRTPSLYVDTDERQFLNGHSGKGLDEVFAGDFSFTPLRDCLTVSTVAAANGRGRVTAGRDWQPLLPLALHLLHENVDEQATVDAAYGPQGVLPNGGGGRKLAPSDWLALMDRPIRLSDGVMRLAVTTGLIEPDGRLPQATRAELTALAEAQASKTFVQDFSQRLFAATEPLTSALAFLGGGWWEVAVMDAAQRCGRFTDLRWSVNVGQAGGVDVEEDIVGLDGVQVLYISCKRGGSLTKNRLLPHLDELNARATSLGGSFTRRCLACCIRPTGIAARQVPQRCKELGIRLITRENVLQGTAFS